MRIILIIVAMTCFSNKFFRSAYSIFQITGGLPERFPRRGPVVIRGSPDQSRPMYHHSPSRMGTSSNTIRVVMAFILLAKSLFHILFIPCSADRDGPVDASGVATP